MHEMSIALSIVEAADSAARRENALRVSVVSLLIGRLAGIERSSLEFCFPLAAKGSLAEGAELQIEERDGHGACLECKERFPIDRLYAECPRCRSLRVDVVSGREFLITSITIDDKES